MNLKLETQTLYASCYMLHVSRFKPHVSCFKLHANTLDFPLLSCYYVRTIHAHAQVVKLVDTQDLKSCAARHTGSSPVLGTHKNPPIYVGGLFLLLYIVPTPPRHYHSYVEQSLQATLPTPVPQTQYLPTVTRHVAR